MKRVEEKLYQAYYEPDRLWRRYNAIMGQNLKMK